MTSKENNNLKLYLTALFLFISVFLYQAVSWAYNNFAGVNIEQIIFQLKVPIAGTDKNIIFSFVFFTLIVSIIISVAFIIIRKIFDKKNKEKTKNKMYSKRQKHLILILNSNLFLVIISSLIIIAALLNANKYFGISNYIQSQMNNSNFIENEYIDPSGKLVFPENKRNLIYIYLESIENTFALKEYGGYLNENIMPELTDIAKENYSFSNNSFDLGGNPRTIGTDYTMAAMFSHSTGLPLKLPITDRSLLKSESFFPGALSLGELLQGEGYNNYLMIGSDASFGGRRNFYSQHGDYEILDYNRAIKNNIIPKDYKVWWGFEDKKLYSWAKDYLTNISMNDAPFNFTMLTVDTHHIDGYFCDLCEDEHEEQYANVISCASRQLDEFINWIKMQDFYGNTTIVIVGDHPTMDKEFVKDVDDSYLRTTYNTFINPAGNLENVKLKNRDFYSFDFFPTTLSSLGVSIKGNRLGLGTDLFSEEPTLYEKYGKEMEEELGKKSTFYENTFLYPKN